MRRRTTRWYACFRCGGNRDQLLQKIEQAVRNNRLTDSFPALAFERDSGKSHEFHLFLAVENHPFGQFPAEGAFIRSLSGIRELVGPMAPDEIQDMTSRELAVQEAARRIPYRAPIADENPFVERAERWQEELRHDNSADATRHARLLTWMSAVGGGSRQTLAVASRCLGMTTEHVSRLLRRYKLLGHLETSEDGLWWSAAPAALVRAGRADDRETYFLAGQRDARLLGLLERLVDCRVTHHPNGGAPPIIEIVEEEPVIEEIADDPHAQVVYAGDAAARLARLLPTIEAWARALTPISRLDPTMHRLRWFNGTDFVDVAAFDSATGFYELWPLSSGFAPGRSHRTAFYDAEREEWLRGEWYGLRFLAHRAHGEIGSAQYEHTSGRFAVHHDWQFPELYERALVLSSGRLPCVNEGWLVYERVSPEVATLLATKLELRLEERLLDA